MSKLFIVLAIVTVVFIQCCDSGRTHKRKQEKPAKSWTGHLENQNEDMSKQVKVPKKEENKQNKSTGKKKKPQNNPLKYVSESELEESDFESPTGEE